MSLHSLPSLHPVLDYFLFSVNMCSLIIINFDIAIFGVCSRHLLRISSSCVVGLVKLSCPCFFSCWWEFWSFACWFYLVYFLWIFFDSGFVQMLWVCIRFERRFVKMSMYGTRDAAANWAAEYGATLVAAGYVQGVASPSIFHNVQHDSTIMVHGDEDASERHSRTSTS